MRKSYFISMAFFNLSIISAIVLVSRWLHDNPPEIRSYADPALFMWASVPLILLFIALLTRPNEKHSSGVHLTLNIVLIALAGSIATIIFIFIAANSLG